MASKPRDITTTGQDTMTDCSAGAALLESVSHRYGDRTALENISISIPSACMVGIIGPDGVGKSTLLALIAGVRKVQTGNVQVLGGNMRSNKHRQGCYARIAYMPQGLGRNLYPSLTVYENLDFVGRLFGLSSEERKARIDDLLFSTSLDSFKDRPAGKLSGGMKQKLSLCGALIHDPDLLILDEPTTGVDPLSRRQFWELIDRIRARQEHMNVIVSTSYMEEAERFDWLAAMNNGQVITTGTPSEIKSETKSQDLESAFVSLLPDQQRKNYQQVDIPPRTEQSKAPVIEAEGLTKRFGDFIAVDHASFRIEKGEIFGFLGSNGCGKSTTMKMLTGLLPASEGVASVLGKSINIRDNDTEGRRQVGYMSQSFSLYSELTVQQNLELHARLYDLPLNERGTRVEEMLEHFQLREVAKSLPSSLPLGLRQRLQLAVALQHKPEILILDEPTSGVDPVARDQFWRYLIDLSRKNGVTIFLSTHFMNEAERCDRISLMHAGKVLAVDTPQALTKVQKASSLEEAFIKYLEDASASSDRQHTHNKTTPKPQILKPTGKSSLKHSFNFQRLWAYSRRESVEILRDPLRLGFAILSPIILLITFGYGISFDVEHLPYAVLDRDQTPQSRQLLRSFEGSRYFERHEDITGAKQIETRLKSGELTLALEIPSQFGKDLIRGQTPELGVWIDGSMPFRAETTRGYLSGLAYNYLADQTMQSTGQAHSLTPINIETRFRYNQSFKSIYAIVPSIITLALIMIPSMMTAVGVVREKETGSIANFRSTPITSFEFLVGKQAPYVVIGMVNLITLVGLAVLVFGVPIKGSVIALLTGVFIYILAATGFGLVVSTFTRTQVAAVFATAIITMIPSVNFSGLLVPVSSLSGSGRVLGLSFPAAWFQQISVGTFTKNLGFSELWINHLVLLAFAFIFIAIATLALKKQET